MSARAWQRRRVKAPLARTMHSCIDALRTGYGLEVHPWPNRAEIARRRRLANNTARRKARHQ